MRAIQAEIADHPGKIMHVQRDYDARTAAGRGANLGVEFDVYWLTPSEMEQRVTDAGFATVFWGGRPAEEEEGSPQGYLVARRC